VRLISRCRTEILAPAAIAPSQPGSVYVCRPSRSTGEASCLVWPATLRLLRSRARSLVRQDAAGRFSRLANTARNWCSVKSPGLHWGLHRDAADEPLPLSRNSDRDMRIAANARPRESRAKLK